MKKLKKEGLVLADIVRHAYYRDECKIIIVYGPLGIGKSTYACSVAAEVYGNPQPDWEKVKDYLVFHPRDFINRCAQLMDKGRREKVLIWDDAGYWLHSLDWWHPFVKAVGKYLNVARTNWGALMFTTPHPQWVIKKVHGIPQAITVRIMKWASDQDHAHRPRLGKGYRMWQAPDLKKTGVRTIFEDYYHAEMPKSFYDWYRPLRDGYARQAIGLMQQELRTLRDYNFDV